MGESISSIADLKPDSSNALSLPADSLVFVGLAFYGTMSAAALLSVMLGQIITKAAITVVSLPLIYAVPAGPLYSEQADQATK